MYYTKDIIVVINMDIVKCSVKYSNDVVPKKATRKTEM